MGTRRLLIALAASFVAVLGWLAVQDRQAPGSDPLTGPSIAGDAPTDSDEAPAELAASEARAASRSAAAADAPEAASATADRDGLLAGVVMSEISGAPLAGARVILTRRIHSGFRFPDMNEREAREAITEVVTDDAGRFEIAVPTALPLDLEVRAAGHASKQRPYVFAGEDLVLWLMAAASLEGTLTRATDSAPVENALIVGRDDRRVEVCRARTGLAGDFLFEDLPSGLITLQITPEDAAVPPSHRVEVEAGTRTRVDLVLDPGVRIHGVVTDPTGRPIAGAEVGLGGSFKRSTTTDVDGTYEMLGVGGARRRDLTDLRARAEGHGGERAKLPFAELTADTRVDFVLRPGRVATGRVLDPKGTPLEGVYVGASGTKKAEGISRTDWVSTTTDAEGRFTLSSLHPLIDHQLFLKKDGLGTRIYDFPTDEAERESIDLGDLVLHPGGRIEGMVTTSTGEAIPEHAVKLRGGNGDLGRFRPEEEAIPNTWVTTVRECRTDSEGRFHFEDVPGGSFAVTTTVPGQPSAKDEASVELEEGQRVDGLSLMLELGIPITGVVLTPDGSPAPGIFVQVAGGPDQPRIRARSGEGGRFELVGVTEAMGEVELFTIVASYNWYNPDAQLGASPTARASAGDSNVKLVLREFVSLSGRVEDADGTPVVDAQVLAFRAGAPQRKDNALKAARTDENGEFSLDLPEQSEVDLVAKFPADLEASAEEDAESETPEPAVLEFVASNAKGVVLRFER